VTLVAAGLGISIVPASMMHLAAPGVTYRPIDGNAPRAAMSLVHFGGGSPAATRAFVGIVEARLDRETAGRT
jgi:DNA-binding transcriptional LysR family regulator